MAKPHSSSWFSAACTAAIVQRNQFFHLHQQNKSSESNVKFRQACNFCKRVPEAAKLAYATKGKESISSQKLGPRYFWRIPNSVLNKGISAIPLLFNGLEVLSSASDKAKLFAKNFSKNSNFDDSIFNIAGYADDITLYSKCDQAFYLWQQLELAFELESNL